MTLSAFQPCPMCNATGERFEGVECHACNGKGKISKFIKVVE